MPFDNFFFSVSQCFTGRGLPIKSKKKVIIQGLLDQFSNRVHKLHLCSIHIFSCSNVSQGTNKQRWKENDSLH